MTSTDDLSDFTGAPDIDAPPAPPRMFVSERHVNFIEQELQERLSGEISDLGLPDIFVGEDGELDEPMRSEAQPWRKFFDGRIPLPHEALAVKTAIEGLIIEKWRDKIAIARSLGPKATMAQYHAQLAKEGIEK